MEAARKIENQPPETAITWGRQVIEHEAAALMRLCESLDERFEQAVQLLLDCRGAVMVTGSGKAGRIGQKISDTLASTGTVSHFLHPSDAVHGDLGRVRAGDIALVLSKSGQTEEVTRLLPGFMEQEIPIVAITAKADSELARAATVLLDLGNVDEACPLKLAPSTSTTAMLAMGDALALSVLKARGFRAEDFAKYHPGGSLGRKLSRVEDCMRPLAECRTSEQTATLRQVLARQTSHRRVGAVMLVDEAGKLTGFLTDSDVARLFAEGRDHLIDGPVSECIVHQPLTVRLGTSMQQAVHLLKRHHFSELPVVDDENRPLGLIDRVDLECLAPTKVENEGSDTFEECEDEFPKVFLGPMR